MEESSALRLCEPFTLEYASFKAVSKVASVVTNRTVAHSKSKMETVNE